MVEVKRIVKLVTEQHIIDKPSEVEGFPMRAWTIEIFMLDESGNEIKPSLFEKATYKLHPSFKNPTQVVRNPTFKISEEGWGEFEMQVVLTATEKGGDHTIPHDLNFQKEHYEARHTITFKNPKPGLLAVLRETGPVPGDENGIKKRKDEGRKKGSKFDMERLADGLQKLQEDDLLHVVQLVHDNKSADTYIKNDIEQGEFHVDLYTLPDNLLKMLWDFTGSKVEI